LQTGNIGFKNSCSMSAKKQNNFEVHNNCTATANKQKQLLNKNIKIKKNILSYW